MQAAVQRLFPHTLPALLPLPKDAGSISSDNWDTALSGALTTAITRCSMFPSVRVPANLPSGAAMSLTRLFGTVQLDLSGKSSTHPQLDTFRRLTDKTIYDTYGAGNIVEFGPNLARLAARPDQFPAHCCSPNLDGRDRARAQLAANIASTKPNHPYQAELIARGNMQWNNPVLMCANKAEDCNVQARIAYSSYANQDSPPETFLRQMEAHGCAFGIVAIQLPIPLLYVNKFQEVDTGAIWEKDEENDTVTCYPGLGDAGYTHKWSVLKKWLDFSDVPMFVEVLYQYGSSMVLRISRNGDEASGTEQYPIIVDTMLGKYAYIEGDVQGIPAFLTSASHYDRLVSYLSTHWDKFAGNLMKAALERISVLTPAIVLGDDKYTDRWVLTNDERLSVAIQACIDVQKMMHRTTLAQRKLEVINSQLATSARRAEASSEPAYTDRMLAWLRGEQVITSSQTVGDYIADALDYRSARTLAQVTHLQKTREIKNGKRGTALAAAPPPVLPPPPQAALPAAGNYVARRAGYLAPGNWWPADTEFWLQNLGGLPAQRPAQLLLPFDPNQNHVAATQALRGLPMNQLTMLQSRAVNNWDWDPNTRIDLLLVGPGGTGKSTHARRIAPPNTCVVVPTNELRRHWQQVYPGHPVLTLDEAVANLNVIRGSPAVIIDEVYQYPAGHVITLCSQNVPVIALGAPEQRTYNGPLGVPFHHTIVPVDHHVICTTIHRYGQDVTNMVNRHAVPIYAREFPQLVGPNFQFNTVNAGVNNIQAQLAQRPGLHLTFHNANTNVFPGCVTIDSAQGTDADDVYVHLFPGDEAAFTANDYAFLLALTRTRNTITFTIPNGMQQQAPLVQRFLRLGLTRRQLVWRRNNVFGSRYDSILHGIEALDNLENVDPEIPKFFDREEEVILTQPQFMGRGIVVEDDLDDVEVDQVHNVISPALQVALVTVHPRARTVKEVLEDKSAIVFRKPDPRLRIRVPEWLEAADFFEPTLYKHIGIPYANTDVLASILAVFDRYTKPQNVAIPNRRALTLAHIMFDEWQKAYVRPESMCVLPDPAALFSNWFSNATALRISQIANELPFIDSARVLTNDYFLKMQGKPKFKDVVVGQGILATNKLMNLNTCPLIVAATKTIQAVLRPHVVYDSGMTQAQLDEAIRATGAQLGNKHLSADLEQQDSSHVNVHRYFIAMVLHSVGFDNGTVAMYLMSRARRVVKGMTMLGLLFEVIERLFSGEPMTALGNWLMEGGTLACELELCDPRPKLIVGKGDDTAVSPAPRKKKMAVNMLKETGVKLKLEYFEYLDFANRIWTKSGKSFPDPVRMVAKYTLRQSKRENTENEWMAYRDQDFTPTSSQREEITHAIAVKHKIPLDVAYDFTDAASALRDPSVYYSSLRPSKVPVEHMPVLRQSRGYDVVFEDLTDRCAPAAIAFIADVDVSEVIAYVCRLRLARPVHPDVRYHNAHSRHPAPFFMDDWEVRQACTKFGVRLAGSELSLLPEGGHVVVVRAKVSWRTSRHQMPNRAFGSWALAAAIGAVALLAAASWHQFQLRFKHWLIAQRDYWVNFLQSVPGEFYAACFVAWYLSTYVLDVKASLWFLTLLTLFMLLVFHPFYRRGLQKHKFVRTIRVEHAAYGTVSARGKNVDQTLLAIALMVATLAYAVGAIDDITWSLRELYWRDFPSNEFILGVGWLVVHLIKNWVVSTGLWRAVFLCFLCGALLRPEFNAIPRKIVWLRIILPFYGIWVLSLWLYEYLGFDFDWMDLLVHVTFPLLGYYFPWRTMRTLTERNYRLMFWMFFAYYMRRDAAWLRKFVSLWARDKQPWQDWMQSNMYTWQDDPNFRSGSSRTSQMWDAINRWIKRRTQRATTQNNDAQLLKDFLDECLHNPRRPLSKYCKNLLKVCHPDKTQTDMKSCLDALQ